MHISTFLFINFTDVYIVLIGIFFIHFSKNKKLTTQEDVVITIVK